MRPVGGVDCNTVLFDAVSMNMPRGNVDLTYVTLRRTDMLYNLFEVCHFGGVNCVVLTVGCMSRAGYNITC